MKEMTAEDIQQTSLEIMQDIHEFCVANNIKYTLQGGTLIGAIRHKGFIPWDDDLDVAMPRPDYDRFIRTYKSEKGYEVFARDLPDSTDVLMSYARVCDMRDTYVDDTFYPWTNRKKGVWIDLFPLDGVSDDYEEAKKQHMKMKFVWSQGMSRRWRNAPFWAVKPFKKKLKLLAKKVLAPFFSDTLFDRHNEMCKAIKWGETEHYSNLAFMGYGIRERHRCAVLDEVILWPFEDRQFFVMAGYDEALKEKYGNYMQLPPKEKQVRGHSIYTYYWANK